MKLKAIGALVLALCLLATPVWARDHSKRFERMSKHLELSEDQKSQIKPLVEAMKQQIQNERDAFRNHLNPEQLSKLDELKKERRRGHRGLPEKLELNEGQLTAFEQMKSNVKAHRKLFKENFQALLTPEQQQKLEQRKRHGKHRFKRMARFLELTEEQREQVRPLRKALKEKMKSEREAFRATLTPEQLAKAEELKSNRKRRGKAERRGKKRGGDRDERAQRWAQELGLDEAQQASFDQMRANLKAEREKFREQFHALLTPEQLDKLEQRKQKRNK